MLRILLSSLEVVSFLATAFVVAHAQSGTLEPTPPCPPSATASISGQVTLVGAPPYDGYTTSLLWIPTYVEQPIHLSPNLLTYQVETDPAGRYDIPCLIGGEYFVILSEEARILDPTVEYVRFISSRDGISSLPALRVRVEDGQSVTEVGFSITFATSEPTGEVPSTATPTPVQHTEGPQPYDDVSLPPTGSGAGQAVHDRQVILLTAMLCGFALACGLGARYLRHRAR